MKSLLLFSAAILSASVITAQGFAGSLEFRYATQKDTSLNVYHVKDNMVKLEQFSKKNDKTIEGSFLFDLTAGEVKFLNPKRKLWGRQKSETPPIITGQCIVSEGKGIKTIAGVKCREYNVKNVDENTSITYWIAEDKYNFFIPLMKLWNRKDKQSVYFAQIKNLKPGSMPMMSEERTLDGKVLTKLEVVKISKTAPPETAFMVPKDYSKLDQ